MQFSKRDTLIMKGVAILFLVAYHYFLSVSRLNGYDVDFSPFSQKTAIYICENMNICVGMFAFMIAFSLILYFAVMGIKKLIHLDKIVKWFSDRVRNA